MTVDQALKELKMLTGGDPETDHLEADKILMAVVRDNVPGGMELAVAFDAIPKWYA